jgi:hypothetical protein
MGVEMLKLIGLNEGTGRDEKDRVKQREINVWWGPYCDLR